MSISHIPTPDSTDPAAETPLTASTPEGLREFLGDMDLGRGMLEAYIREIFPADLQRWQILAVETEWRRELLPSLPRAGSRRRFPVGLDAAGKCDLVVLDHLTNQILIVDHKSMTQVPDDHLLRIDGQARTYLWGYATETPDARADGFIHNVLVKSVPHPPKLLKGRGKTPNRALSTDKRQVTTLELYRAAISEHGLAESDYTEMLDHLAQNPRRFFARNSVRHTPETLAEHDAEMRWISIERAEASCYRAEHFISCGMCPYVGPLCEVDTPANREGFRVLSESHIELDEMRPKRHNDRPIITTSEISEWKRCHRRHALHYGERLVPIVEARALRFGRGIHAALALLYQSAKDEKPNTIEPLKLWNSWCADECMRMFHLSIEDLPSILAKAGGTVGEIAETVQRDE